VVRASIAITDVGQQASLLLAPAGTKPGGAENASVPLPVAAHPRSRARQGLLAATLVLIAFNLRPLFPSLSALLPSITLSSGLSPSGASLMTTLPVLCLGVFAPCAPVLARRFGAERTILCLMVLLTLGTATRGLAGVPTLAFGTVAAGISIAVINVLVPGLIKRDFSRRIGLMSGLYTMALCGGAAAAAGLTIPLQRLLALSWAGALALWALPALAAVLLWAPQTPRASPKAHARVVVQGCWRCPLAWQLTAFMVLQSMLSFSVFGWLAPMLHDRGLSAATAGLIVSVSVLCQATACLVAPPLAARSRDQRLVNTVAVLLAVAGYLGCLFAPLSTVWIWALLQGFGQGALTSVALTLIVLRSGDADVAAVLSGMVQGVGYGVGASGPLLVGMLRAWTGGFHAVGWLFAAVGVLAIVVGWGAGRDRHVAAKSATVSRS
jgi:CP family cyanate transporter-like MFS transporter